MAREPVVERVVPAVRFPKRDGRVLVALRAAVFPRVDGERPRVETPARLPVVARVPVRPAVVERERRRFMAAWRCAAEEVRLRVAVLRDPAVPRVLRLVLGRVVPERVVVGARALVLGRV